MITPSKTIETREVWFFALPMNGRDFQDAKLQATEHALAMSKGVWFDDLFTVTADGDSLRIEFVKQARRG